MAPATPVIKDQMSWPSIFRSAGSGKSISRAKVGSKSIVVQSSSQVVPAGMRPGSRITHGSR